MIRMGPEKLTNRILPYYLSKKKTRGHDSRDGNQFAKDGDHE